MCFPIVFSDVYFRDLFGKNPRAREPCEGARHKSTGIHVDVSNVFLNLFAVAGI